MSPATLIREAQSDGVMLSLSLAGNIKASGDRAAVDRWLPMIRDRKAEIIDALKISAPDTASASRWWVIHYPDRDPLELAFYPEATYAEILEWHPDALRIEPGRRDQSGDSDPQADSVSLKWAELVGEDDPVAIRALVRAVRFDPDARNWIMGQLIRSSGEQA
jgi:hypothetical protein